jgi:hypothetical protein
MSDVKHCTSTVLTLYSYYVNTVSKHARTLR